MKHAQQYFDNHEQTEKLYFTSDGLAFFDKQNALNHSANLDDVVVTEMTREEAYSQVAALASDAWDDDEDDELDGE